MAERTVVLENRMTASITGEWWLRVATLARKNSSSGQSSVETEPGGGTSSGEHLLLDVSALTSLKGDPLNGRELFAMPLASGAER